MRNYVLATAAAAALLAAQPAAAEIITVDYEGDFPRSHRFSGFSGQTTLVGTYT